MSHQTASITPISAEAFTDQAKQLGFTHVALLDLAQLDAAWHDTRQAQLQQWLDAGYHADMGWMTRNQDKRLDPGALMADTATVACMTLNYYSSSPPPSCPDASNGPLTIARYARGDDYHQVLKEKLRDLLAWCQARDAGFKGRPLTDSAPMMEKPLAAELGIGWQGKHSNLITRSHGSWVFIAELLINRRFADVDAPTPHPDMCGRCRRCIDACPTHALDQPYVLDANRCIAYWTIEYRGEQLPTHIAEHLNGWVFGCDICQEVCPWNIRFAQPTTEAAFEARLHNTALHADELLALDEATFSQRYDNSPVERTGLANLKRNARAATGQD
ncbi:MAG: tRNA epoxyqueuosine(34) reductase QueG [Cyanobacteria bacterium HKST-UBA06]|nr:tRNA epoxyqueuosine(34) reductase QueG [Cyanobacteria bacterium HKST-UBA06]